MAKILIIDPFPSEFVAELQTIGEVTFSPDCSSAEALTLLKDAEILILNSKIRLDKTALDRATNLRLACRAGVGLDHFDLPLMESLNIAVAFTPGANAAPVAEQAVGMLIGLMHHIARANSQVKNRKWIREENRATELMGKTVGIIGFGNTGSAFAQRLSGFGMNILAYDKYKTDFPFSSQMEMIFEEADILSLHVPLTPETHFLVEDTFIEKFRKKIWLLNLSRGEVVKTTDLIKALKSGKIPGAGLDVHENEKLETHTELQKENFETLIKMNNVILTPHTGGWSHESLKRINDEIIRKVRSFISANNF